VSKPAGGQPAGPQVSDLRWAESVGNIAAPLLAGFSFTAVIAVGADVGKFRWADAAILSLTVAAVALIAAVQCSKYVHEEDPSWERWYGGTLLSYHAGLVALLLGLGFVLAPPHVSDWLAPRWWACYIALAASVGQAVSFALGKRNWSFAAYKLFKRH
jgi:hypothetical protein